MQIKERDILTQVDVIAQHLGEAKKLHGEGKDIAPHLDVLVNMAADLQRMLTSDVFQQTSVWVMPADSKPAEEQ